MAAITLQRRVVPIGEGPCLECPACAETAPFDLQLTYCSLRVGALGAAGCRRWLFQCRACHRSWPAKRSVVHELEQAGVPIPLLERDGLLMALSALALLLLLLRV